MFSISFFILSLFTLLIIFFSVALSSKFYDTSSDGSKYHQDIILTLTDEGWNPIKSYNPPVKRFPGTETWIKHYAKGSEILASSIYIITDNIESSKAFSILFVFATFFSVYYLLVESLQVDRKYSFLIALTISMNPVSSYQTLSFYVDGIISSLFILSVVFLILYVRNRNKLYLLLFLLNIVLLSSIKFTSLFYAVLLSIVLLFFLMFKKTSIKEILKDAITILVVGIIAVFIVNYNPYSLNFLNEGNPLYPIFGKNSLDVISTQYPEGHEELIPLERFISSHFILEAKEGDISFRFPLRLSEDFYIFFQAVDFRKGGFGPFYMEISIITILLFGALLFGRHIDFKSKFLLIISSALLFLSVLVIPMSWWARFVPQLYIINLIPLIFVFKDKKNSYLGRLLLTLLMLNSLYVMTFHLKEWYILSRSVKTVIQNLKKEEREIFVYREIPFNNNIKRLEENGISYTILTDKKDWESLKEHKRLFPKSSFQIGFND
jgi:hypothetical protein